MHYGTAKNPLYVRPFVDRNDSLSCFHGDHGIPQGDAHLNACVCIGTKGVVGFNIARQDDSEPERQEESNNYGLVTMDARIAGRRFELLNAMEV